MANFSGTAGDDTLIGTPSDDTFDVSQGGTDVVSSGDGDDVIGAGVAFDALDRIDGGSGFDRLDLLGDYSAGVGLGSLTLRNVEDIVLGAGFDYKIISSDATVNIGATLIIDGSDLRAANTLSVDGSAETDGQFQFTDGLGNDDLIGGSGNDSFLGIRRGSDIFRGNDGNDFFNMNGNLDSTDRIDGGPGFDEVRLRGDYSAGLVLGASTIKSVEAFEIGGNYDYKIIASDASFGPAQRISVQTLVAPGHHVEFDASAETDTSFEFVSLAGRAIFSGGAQDDLFVLRDGDNDIVNGGGGADTFRFRFGFTVADRLNGGSGEDTLYLGEHPRSMLLTDQTIRGIETIILEGNDCAMTSTDATVAAGSHLTVDGSSLRTGFRLDFNGSAETDGRFVLIGSKWNDALYGGAMNDRLNGGLGSDTLIGGAGIDTLQGGANAYADTLTGGLGHDNLYGGDGKHVGDTGDDRFVLQQIDDSTVADADWIRDWNAGDRIVVSAIDANTGLAGDQAFAFIGASAFSAAGQLQTRTTAFNTIVRGDIDGDGAADFTVKLAGVQDLGAGSFIL